MSLVTQLAQYTQHITVLADGTRVNYLQVGERAAGTPIVLLHGIGSNAGSWIKQLQHGFSGRRMLACHAPGYENSTPLAMPSPNAAAYAKQLWAWLDALGITRVHLVGHSLGCIMAASASALQAQRVESLTLLAPAQGYGTATDAVRYEKCGKRLELLKELGVQGMAQLRGAALLSATAAQDDKDYAIAMMGRINIAGYTQATKLLAHSNIQEDLAVWCAVTNQQARSIVACGEHDAMTPLAQCAALAQMHGIGFTAIEGAGHLCALENPDAVNACITQAINQTQNASCAT